MKVGLGLYRQLLTTENFRFAKQAGATHIVAHLAGYWGRSGDPADAWSFDKVGELRAAVEAEGLTLEAIENFEPADWSDILLDGPRRAEQIAGLKTIIRNVGRAGVPVLGYYFSLAGVWGRVDLPAARGGAMTVVYDDPPQTPIPRGMVWNIVYDPDVYDPADPAAVVAPVSETEIWRRFEAFLAEVVPVAEEAGVKLALHPDDPPLPSLRGCARLVHRPDHYQRVLDVVPSPANCMEFCVGTLSEMADANIYDMVDRYSRTGRIAYVHFRNVRGTVPHYEEVFVDEGATDMFEVLRILSGNGFNGVIIPDHTPQMTCDAPWHAGMAYALGWIRAAMRATGCLG